MAPVPPVPDPDLLPALRADLAAYTVGAVDSLLGPAATAALEREDPVPARRVLAGRDEPVAVLLRVFTLGAATDRAELDRVLPALGADGARRLGLVADRAGGAGGEGGAGGAGGAGGTLRAAVDLRPYESVDELGTARWWIASDLGELARPGELAGGHTLGIGSASLTLAAITPRPRVGRTLDLGTGCGVQALHAARHSGAVVATDLSERALAFAAFNAALNGAQLDLRTGSFLEPVAGERFDLIVSNPPFVITPRTLDRDTWTYRDAGRAGDEAVGDLVAGAGAHLMPGGLAVMLANWEITGGDWTEHPRSWLDRGARDGAAVWAWIIQREVQDPAEYAATWIRDGGVLPGTAAHAELMESWLDDLEARGVTGIGFGYVVLTAPRAGEEPCPHRFEDHRGPIAQPLGPHVLDVVRRRRMLSAFDDEALLSLRLRVADDVTEHRHLRPGAPHPTVIELVQGGGLRRTVRATTELAGFAGACDGELTAGQLLTGIAALLEADRHALATDLVPRIRSLVVDGFLDVV